MQATTFRVGMEPTDADRGEEKDTGRVPGAEVDEVRAGRSSSIRATAR